MSGEGFLNDLRSMGSNHRLLESSSHLRVAFSKEPAELSTFRDGLGHVSFVPSGGAFLVFGNVKWTRQRLR